MRKSLWLLLTMCVGLGACNGVSTPLPETVNAPTRELTTQEKDIIRAVVVKNLRDPDAAKFQWVPLVVSGAVVDAGATTANGDAAYCGLVNGKNLYGAYVGFRPFLVKMATGKVPSAVFYSLSTGPDDVGYDAVAALCSHFGYTDFSNAK